MSQFVRLCLTRPLEYRDMKTSELIEEVSLLPVEERAMVAECILKSLNPSEPEIDREWLGVAQQRLADLLSKNVQAVPGDQVIAGLRQRFSV